MQFDAYILKTTIYRVDLSADSKEDAELQLAKKMNEEIAGEDFEAIESWWDDEHIEVEENLLPEENCLMRGFELDSAGDIHYTPEKRERGARERARGDTPSE